MTDYNAILDTETDPSAPLKSSLFKRIVANPLAIGEGSTGAPRIVGAAIKRLADMPVLTVSASDAFDAAPLCDVVVGTLSTNSGTYQTAYTITVKRGTGSIRFKLSHSANDDAAGTGEQSRLSVTKNGVEITNWQTSGNNIERSVDVAVVPDDVILWRHRRDNGSAISGVTVSGMTILASDSYTTRPAYVSQLLKDAP
jgi:hypothetical protein